MKLVLGIDVGTTGTKALLVAEDGQIHGKGYKGYGLITGQGGVVEQDPEDWWNAVIYAVREATKDIRYKDQIIGLSLSTQGGSSLLLDRERKPLCNAITWMDTRSKTEKMHLEKINTNDAIYYKTGWRLGETLDAAKLLWLKNNFEHFDRARYFVSTIEYINLKLTGNMVIDLTNGAIRQLMNLKTSTWDKEIFDFMGTESSMMPSIAASGTLIGSLTAESAEQLGLSETIKVYNGAHDQYCGALGAGAVKAGDMTLSTGTAWVSMGFTKEPMFSTSYMSPAQHIVKGLWGALASIPVGGAALDWFNRIAMDTYEDINIHSQNRMRKVEDLFFYPYLIGAKFPVWNENARGTFTGINLDNDKYDMFRAVMEGVAFQVKMSIQEYERNGTVIDTIRLTGGATKSELWMSIIAAVTGKQLYRCEADGACIGAAAIAAVSAGLYKDYEEAMNTMAILRPVELCDQSDISFYNDKYQRYMSAWKHLIRIYE